MATRKPWKDLTPAYRKRLERQGITARNHGVANLIRARGHQPSRPAGAADEALVNRVVSGDATYEELLNLERTFTRPAWIPNKYAPDVAAALSQLPNPKKWDHVEFEPVGDGEPWTMTVFLKGNAYPRSILIPGGGGPGSGAKEVLELVTSLVKVSEETAEQKRHREMEALFFEVMESP